MYTSFFDGAFAGSVHVMALYIRQPNQYHLYYAYQQIKKFLL